MPSVRPAGPSWRMVEVPDHQAPGLRGYGIYPGEQSGNPGSFQFAAFVRDYEAGAAAYRRAIFLPSAADFGAGERLRRECGCAGWAVSVRGGEGAAAQSRRSEVSA